MHRRTFLNLAGVGILSSGALASIPAPRKTSLPPGGVRWGLEGLDSATSLQPGEVCVVIGQAGSGKTLLMTNAVEHTLERDGGFCSYFDSDGSLGHYGGIFADPRRTFVSAHPCDRESFLGHVEHCGRHCRLVVCDTITGYPSAKSSPVQSLRDVLSDLRKIATTIEVPILVGVQTNRPPRGHTSSVKSCDWLDSADLVLSCKKIEVQPKGQPTAPWTRAIQVHIMKNRYGPSDVSYLHGLSSHINRTEE